MNGNDGEAFPAPPAGTPDEAPKETHDTQSPSEATPEGTTGEDLSQRRGERIRNRRKNMWQWPLLVVLLIAVVWTFGALFSRHLFLYHPTSLTEEELMEMVAANPRWSVDVTSFTVAENAGDKPQERSAVGLIRYGAPNAPWVLYFGGNAQSLANSRALLDSLLGDRPWGAAVWAYRGYDGTPGSPTERRLVADGLALARTLMHRQSVEPKRLVIVGQSLGSGVATQVAKGLAAEGEPAGALVLVSPFRSIPAVGNDHFFWPLGHTVPDKYDNMKHLPATESPVMIVHGTDDDVIPYRHGKALHEANTPRSEFVSVDGYGHNDVWSAPQLTNNVRQFIERHAYQREHE